LVAQAQIKCWLADQTERSSKKEEIGDAEIVKILWTKISKKISLRTSDVRACSQRFACKRNRGASELSFLCQDKTLFVKMKIQTTDNQRI
jgi:hypothetical protein